MTEIYLKDYVEPNFAVEKVNLTFELEKSTTTITNEFSLIFNPEQKDTSLPPNTLILDGNSEYLELISISVNGLNLTQDKDFLKSKKEITLINAPQNGIYKIVTKVHPEINTAFEGLYYSNGVLLTQNEPEGFRNLTFFPDRPDVRAPYTVKLIALKADFPTLLSNPMLATKGDLENGYHYAEFVDPNPKPSYLFCLVAGNLACIEKTITYPSGKDVVLKLWAHQDKLENGHRALEIHATSLLDYEKDYGIEYDLPEFHVTGVPDFNMGAMENTGLNVYNEYTLMSSITHTRFYQYAAAAHTIPHELAHHISGNRIGIKGNWFNLAVKEGLAEILSVIQDEKVRNSKATRAHRISTLRSRLFPFDNGPQTHPVRMQSYDNLENMYDDITYIKGSELWYTLKELVGEEHFKESIRIYAQMFKNKMASIEDLLHIIEKQSGLSLEQFILWWDQSGTPEVFITDSYDEENKTYKITLKQNTPTTNNQPKQPLMIPVAVKLFDKEGKTIPINLLDDDETLDSTILNFNAKHQVFTFTNVATKPIPSLFRNMSAPVQIKQSPLETEALLTLMNCENDFVSRWDSAQSLYRSELGRIYQCIKSSSFFDIDDRIISAWGTVLTNNTIPLDEKLAILTLPTNTELFQYQPYIDHAAMRNTKNVISFRLAQVFKEELESIKKELISDLTDIYNYENESKIEFIRMINQHLSYYANECTDKELRTEFAEESQKLFDDYTALEIKLLAITSFHATYDENHDTDWKLFQKAYYTFKETQNENGLLSLYSLIGKSDDALVNISKVIALPTYNNTNAKDVLALWQAFTSNVLFHNLSEKGYGMLAHEIIRCSPINESTASRLIRVFNEANNLDVEHCESMRSALSTILDHQDSSPSCVSAAKKILAQPSQNEKTFLRQLEYIRNSSETEDANRIAGNLHHYYYGLPENSLDTFIHNLVNNFNGKVQYITNEELNTLITDKASVFMRLLEIGAPDLLEGIFNQTQPENTVKEADPITQQTPVMISFQSGIEVTTSIYQDSQNTASVMDVNESISSNRNKPPSIQSNILYQFNEQKEAATFHQQKPNENYFSSRASSKPNLMFTRYSQNFNTDVAQPASTTGYPNQQSMNPGSSGAFLFVKTRARDDQWSHPANLGGNTIPKPK